jgi:hypothetical protein
MPGMRRQFLLVFVFVLLSAVSLSAQSPLEKVFPDGFGHWTASSSLIKVKADTEEQLKVLVEAGLVDVMARDYSNGSQQMSVSLYQLRDPSSAYSVLTYFSPPKYHSHEVFQVGNFVVSAGGAQDFGEADRRLLADAIRKSADTAPLPPIRDYLPESGRVSGTERYALGPVAFRAAAEALDRTAFAALADLVGFSSGAEAMFARYRVGTQAAVLLLIDYPTPQLAELHLKHLEGAVLTARRAGSSLEQVERAGTAIERKGSLLSIVLAPTSVVYAESLRGAVNYETQVTWNEPGATATDPPWVTVLTRIFVGTGVFMVVAVVLGIAFGGVRVLTKIFLPGKVFDRPEQMDILQLGLSGKPIDSRDFYGSS